MHKSVGDQQRIDQDIVYNHADIVHSVLENDCTQQSYASMRKPRDERKLIGTEQNL